MNLRFRTFAVAVAIGFLASSASASDGAILSEPAIGVPNTSFDSAALATDGENVLVAWESTRLAGREEVQAPGIFATIVKPDGRLLPVTPIALFIEPAYAWIDNLSASWDGAAYTIAWEVVVALHGGGSYVARISPTGEIVQAPTRLPDAQVTSGSKRGAPSVVEPAESEVLGTIRTSSDTFVVRNERTDFSSRLTGTFLGSGVSTVISIGPHSQVSALTSGGGLYFLAWVDNSWPRQVWCGRVGADGSPLDGRGILLGEASNVAIAAAFDGWSFVVSWAGTDNIMARRVELDGRLGPALSVAPTPSRFVQLTLSSNDTDTLLAWSDQGIQGALLSGTAVRPLGSISPAHVTPPGGTYSTRTPRLAWTGEHWLLTWTEWARPCPRDFCSGTQAIKFVRIAADGRRMDSHATTLGREVPLGQIVVFLRSSNVSSSGRDSLIVWDDPEGDGRAGDVRGARVSLDGLLLDPSEGFVIDSWKTGRTFSGPDPNTIWTGDSYTVVWNRFYPHTNSTGLVVQTIGDVAAEPVRATIPVAGRWTDNAQVARGPANAVLISNDEIRLEAPFLGSSLAVGVFQSELPETPQPPLAPANIHANVEGNRVAVSWSDVADNEAGYIVEVKYLYGVERVALPADSQSALVSTGLSFNVPKELRVWAYNHGGESPMITIQLEPSTRDVRRVR